MLEASNNSKYAIIVYKYVFMNFKRPVLIPAPLQTHVKDTDFLQEEIYLSFWQ